MIVDHVQGHLATAHEPLDKTLHEKAGIIQHEPVSGQGRQLGKGLENEISPGACTGTSRSTLLCTGPYFCFSLAALKALHPVMTTINNTMRKITCRIETLLFKGKWKFHWIRYFLFRACISASMMRVRTLVMSA